MITALHGFLTPWLTCSTVLCATISKHIFSMGAFPTKTHVFMIVLELSQFLCITCLPSNRNWPEILKNWYCNEFTWWIFFFSENELGLHYNWYNVKLLLHCFLRDLQWNLKVLFSPSYIYIYILLTTVTACSRAIFFLLEYICFLVVPYLKCFCFVQCLCTSDDGDVEETSKYRLCYYIYHLSEQHRSIWPFWSDMSAFKWKYSIFWRNIGLLTGKWCVNKSVLSTSIRLCIKYLILD